MCTEHGASSGWPSTAEMRLPCLGAAPVGAYNQVSRRPSGRAGRTTQGAYSGIADEGTEGRSFP